MSNSDVFWFYTEPISSIIFKLDVAACFKKMLFIFCNPEKKNIFAASLTLPYM